MPKYRRNPPAAENLMASARSLGNYDLSSAVADLIDNSIKARATTISLTCEYNNGDPEIRILDDGEGMTEKQLLEAMRPASTNPEDERPSDDLGRFGWGLKSASFSQCRKLTVVTRRNNVLSGAEWDLGDIANWKMATYDKKELSAFCDPTLQASGCSGTEVIWRDCDRLCEDGHLTDTQFNELIAVATRKLGLTFHRYIARKAKQKFTITLNHQAIDAVDPFLSRHPAVQVLEKENVSVARGPKVVMVPYILPHYSKLSQRDLELVEGPEGMLRNQGFYVYRNHRLIHHGTWFQLLQHAELSNLVRVSIDLPNVLDAEWKLTIDKSDVQLPQRYKRQLRRLLDKIKRKSVNVHRGKGGKTSTPKSKTTSMWERLSRHGDIRYRIVREHPVIKQLLKLVQDKENEKFANAALKMIEQEFPVATFEHDVTEENYVIQTATQEKTFREQMHATLPVLYANQGSGHNGKKRFVALLKTTEPYKEHWRMVKEYLETHLKFTTKELS